MVHKRILRRAAVLLALLILVGAGRVSASADTLSVERQVYAYLTEKMGLSTAAACGILANIEHESAFQPTIVGDQGTSYGLCQWHNERYSALRTYCGALGLDYRTVEGQMAYLNYELGNNYTSLLLTLKSIDNTPEGAYRAAYLWCVQFERPSNMEVKAASRGNLARNKYWNRYNSVSVIILPQEEPEQQSTEQLVQYLTQHPVTIPLAPEDTSASGTRQYRARKPDFLSYNPWHMPAAEPVPENSLLWGIPALVSIGAAAVAVVLWPAGRRPREKAKSGKS